MTIRLRPRPRPELGLAYNLAHEAWYAKPGDIPTIDVYARNGTDGHWELTFTEHVLNGAPAIKLEIFGDSFTAFSDVPDLFILLRTLHSDRPIRDVHRALKDLGAVDETGRTKRKARTWH